MEASGSAVSERATTATLLDGIALSAKIITHIRALLQPYTEAGQRPRLAVVTCGARKDSESFIRTKKREGAKAGIDIVTRCMPVDIAQGELLREVDALNDGAYVCCVWLAVCLSVSCWICVPHWFAADPSVDGIVIQLPLPGHINDLIVCQSIAQEKDVDSLHKENLGLLTIPRMEPIHYPCIAKGTLDCVLVLVCDLLCCQG